MRSDPAPPQWRLCVIVSAELCPAGDWASVARAAVDAGADALQLREKGLADRDLLARARALVAIARERGASVVVNDRPDIAVLSGADGLHLGQTDLPIPEARRIVGPRVIVGASTADLEQASAAVAAGADVCGVGPMFPTTTKHKDRIAGISYLRAFRSAHPAVPHLAIGGIAPGNVGAVFAAGGRGVAVSSAVCAARDPAAAVRAILAAARAGERGEEAEPRA